MIKVADLTRHFDQRGIAGVHHLNFDLEEGQVLGLIGPNGSGKTTLLKMLSGSLKQDTGFYSINGTISLFPDDENFENINVQKFLVNSVTLEIDEEKKVQLTRDLADTFEFTFQLRQNLNELSSGQKQKILLARKLINKPSVLLMDEPFTHLDPFTRKIILSDLFLYIRHQKITVLWVTHDLDEAFKLSDIIAVMNFGRFEQLENPESVMRRPKNLFVAKFIGYRNFFPVKSEGHEQSTPWGTSHLPALNTPEGILIIPDHAWELGDEGLPFTVVSRHAEKQSMEYLLSNETRSAYWIRGVQLPLLQTGVQIKILPRWEECFTIPL